MAAFASGGDQEGGGESFGDSGGTGRAADFSHSIQPERKNKKSKRRVSHLRGMWNQIKPMNKLSRVGDSPRLKDGHICDAPPQMRRRDTPSSPWGSPVPRKAAKGKAFKGSASTSRYPIVLFCVIFLGFIL